MRIRPVVFSSQVFLFVFLPLCLGLYFAMPRRGRHLVLTLLSYLFYGWANPLFVVLMLASTSIDYLCGLVISGQWRPSRPMESLPAAQPRSRAQRAALLISIVSNLSLLAFFKYFDFAVSSYDGLISALGLESARLDIWLRITLPLGISFYTFQSMSYSIDVYRGQARAIRNFIDFACYVAMFPQLVAGPIIRFQEVADQLRNREHSLDKFSRGVSFLMLGLAKKVLLANTCGKLADVAFSAGALDSLDAWIGMLAYTFQIYFDFSGYSDMAIGLGLMLGFVFPKNFDSPLKADSITEFWRRWHLSLSTWLRDYLYIPLGGNRQGEARSYFNLLAVMLLGGLWHGAAWNFILWGGLHGLWLAAERSMGKRSLTPWLPRPLRVALTFFGIALTFVFFRAADLPSALAYLGAMFGLVPGADSAGLLAGLTLHPFYLSALALAAGIVFAGPQTWDFTRRLSWPKTLAVSAAGLAAVAMLITQSFNPFIYFIF